MTFRELDREIDKAIKAFETSRIPGVMEGLYKKHLDLGKQKLAKCDELTRRAKEHYESGMISEDYYQEIMEGIEDEKNATMFKVKPYLEEVDHALALSIALSETAQLSSSFISKVPSSTIKDLSNIGMKKYIISRLKRYTLVFPTVNFDQFEHEAFSFEEMDRFPQIKFKYAEGWVKRGVSRIDCTVYYYNKKPVMAIAHSKKNKDESRNEIFLETCICDSRMRAHEDYYVASMAVHAQVTHPAIKRVLTKLQKEWKKQTVKQKSLVAEESCDAYINDVWDKKVDNVIIGVLHGDISEKDARIYITCMESALYK